MVFADTSALFAFLVADDRHHSDAVRVEVSLRAQREMLWTIDPVLTELWLLRQLAAPNFAAHPVRFHDILRGR